MKKIFFFLLCSTVVFLNSCSNKTNPSDEPNNLLHFSSLEDILKMNPIKITISRWTEYEKQTDLEIETEEEAKAAFNDPNNWFIKFIITDKNKIKEIVSALKIPPIEKTVGMPSNEFRICFEDKNKNYKSTIFAPSRSENKLYFSDEVYGKETYDVFTKILDSKPIQEPNQP